MSTYNAYKKNARTNKKTTTNIKNKTNFKQQTKHNKNNNNAHTHEVHTLWAIGKLRPPQIATIRQTNNHINNITTQKQEYEQIQDAKNITHQKTLQHTTHTRKQKDTSSNSSRMPNMY